jgi:hypothetical protein
MLEDAQAPVLLTQTKLLASLPALKQNRASMVMRCG